MKVSFINTTNYRLTELDRLDPVTVITENHEPGRGKIIIDCYGKSWSSFWGSMSGDTVEAFFCRGNVHYLANRLAPGLDSNIADLEALSEAIGVAVEDRRAIYWDNEVTEAIRAHYDCEPHEADLPTKINPEYEYLCRIIKAVQAGFAMSASGGDA